MIVSHAHKFIFIKNRKVGSTSTELALQKICGPEDILTPDAMYLRGAPPRKTDALFAEARNWRGRFNPTRELLQARTPMDVARSLRDFWQRPRFYNHMRAASVRARVPRTVWDSYYKFCFDRNPWDKVISFYFWYGRHGQDMPEFNEFLLNYRRYGTADQILPSDWARYTLHDHIIVDDVFDFDDLRGGLTVALKRAGVAPDTIARARLGNEKTKVRKQPSLVFRPETDALIRQAFRREIATFEFCRVPAPGLVDGAV